MDSRALWTGDNDRIGDLLVGEDGVKEQEESGWYIWGASHTEAGLWEDGALLQLLSLHSYSWAPQAD